MSTAYHVETIERITEQMLEEEVLAETEGIRGDSNKQVEKIKTEAVNYIDKEKSSLQTKLGTNGVQKTLKDLDNQASTIYKNLQNIVPNTEKSIEENVRQQIVDNGFRIVTNNDKSGNVTVTLGRVL